MARPLDIDPKALSLDFHREWNTFIHERIHTFLIYFLEKRISEHLSALETKPLEEVQKLQGQIHEARQVLLLLKTDYLHDVLPKVLAYLESKQK